MCVPYLSLLTYLAFNGVWFVCAYGAARGNNSVGVAAAVLFIFTSLWAKDWPSGEVKLILAAGVAGACIESSLAAIGFVHFSATPEGSTMAPPWIVALWLAFGATVSQTAERLGSHAVCKAGVLGVILGPLAYATGEKFGALSIIGASWKAYAALSVVWLVVFPALVAFNARLSLKQHKS